MGRSKSKKKAEEASKAGPLASNESLESQRTRAKPTSSEAPPLVLEELEARILLSTFTLQDPGAASGVEEQEMSADEVARLSSALGASSPTNFDDADAMDAGAEQPASEIRRELVFIDEGVGDSEALLNDLMANADGGREFEVVLLSNARDGIEQISDALADYHDLDAIHIISHGSDGSIELGNTSLNTETLEDNNLKIALWANSFAESGDILIYGCNLAETEVGKSLVSELSGLTLADVAASDDVTGTVAQGGDWNLEFASGSIEAATVLDDDVSLEEALGVVSIEDPWTNVTVSTDRSTTISENHTVTAAPGSDRLLLVTMVTRFGFDQTIDVTSATFGGVQLHEIVEGSSNTTRNGVWMGYLLDSEIPDGEQSLSVSFTSTVSDPTGTKLLAATYVGVDQTTPVNDSSANNTKANAPITFGSQIDHAAGAEVVYVASFGGNTNTNTTEPAGFSKIYTNEWSGLLMTTIGHMDDTSTAGSSAASTAVDFEGTDANHSLAVVALNAVPDVNEDPVITSDGGAATTSINVAENTTAVTTVTATDPDLDTPTFSITGGADQGLFSIDTNSGVLTFDSAPDYEVPGDVGANNVYQVDVTASDGNGGTDSQAINVTVTNANDAPTFIGGSVGYWQFDEGSGDSAADQALGTTAVLGSSAGVDANDPTWTTGHSGQALHFDGLNDYVEVADDPRLDIGGSEFSASLWMKPDSGPNKEDMLFMKGDRQGNVNYYLSWKDSGEMTWAFKDGTGWNYLDMNVTMPTTDEWNHVAISFDRPTVSLYVNGEKFFFDNVATGGSMDRDLTANDDPLWIGAGRSGGAIVGVNDWSGPFDGSIDDLALFDRALTDGEVEMIRTSPPSAATATEFVVDENAANDTVVGTVAATDQDVGDSLAYTITGGNTGGAFSIDANGTIKVANSGALDFETNPIFSLAVEATDDGTPNLSDSTTVTITLNDVNDAPTITSDGAGATASVNVAENTTDVTTVAATDQDLETPTFSITGGADETLFEIDTNSGALTFKVAPDYEGPGDNLYEVVVTASDGNGGTDVQTISVAVTNVHAAITATGATQINEGEPYTLNLTADESVTSWTINWGDGAIDTVVGTATDATHTYTNGGFTNNISVSATDATGTVFTNALVVGNAATGADGFALRFGFDPATGQADLGGMQTLNTPNPADLDWAQDVVVGPDGNIYVEGYQSNNIVKFDGATGAYLGEFVSMTRPTTIAFGPGGNLYVASDLGHVKRFDGTTGAFIDDFLTGLSFTPEEIEFGPDGNVYIGDYNSSSRIWRYDPVTGANLDGGSPFIDPANGGPEDILRCQQIAFGPDGNIYVASQLNGKIQRFSGTDGSFMDTFATPGTEPSGWPRGPTGVAFGPDGNLYVAKVDRIERYDGTSGAYIDDYVPAGSGLNNPWFITFTPNQQVAVNALPEITSDGGGVTAGVNVAENQTSVTDVDAWNIDADSISYAITGGVDSSLFDIDTDSGVLTFKSAPNFESPGDTGANNVYEMEVTASDGRGGSDVQTITVTVDDVVPIAVDDAYSVDANATLDVDWWDTAWTQRQELTLDNLGQTETLTDFPVLVVLDPGNIDYSQTKDDGSDLRFVAADGTPLAHEIEQWTEGGESSVWVRVPQITGSSTADSITMYYGNAAAEAASSAGSVWDDDFVGVWHLNQDQAGTGSSGVYTDSTGNGHDGIDRVAATGQEGQVTDGQELGANDWIEIDHDASLDLRDSMTISFWIKPDSDMGTFNRVVEKGLWGYNNSYYFGGGNGTNDLTFYLNGQEVIDTADGVLTVGEWQQAAVSYTSNGDGTGTATIYVNGAAVGSGSYTNGAVVGNSSRLAIGHSEANYDFDGSVDEVQISKTDRSADWIAAHYQATKNQAGGEFVRFLGGVETAPAGGGVLANDSFDDVTTSTASNLDTTGTLGLVALSPDGTFSYDPNGQFDSLAAGATATDTFTYDVMDAGGQTDTATVTITITGVDDAAIVTGDTSFSGNEGDAVGGDLDATDADGLTDTTYFTVSSAATNGTAVIGAETGAWSFTPTDPDWFGTDSFEVTVTDDLGGTTTQIVNITLANVNDAALITGTDTASLNEDTGAIGGYLNDSGSLTATDIDPGESGFIAGTLEGSLGSLTIDASGNWNYTVDNSLPAIQGLASGATVNDVIVVASLDGTTKNVTITISGNASSTAVDDAYSVSEDGTLDADWWDTSWTQRQTLTLDNSAQSETLVDFPVLVVLNSGNIDYAQTSDDGSDLRFFDADGAALDFDIEQWDESGDSYVWVKVPQVVGSSSSGSIMMYYGNAGATSAENASAVWSNGFEAVHHLGDDLSDATVDNHDATSTGTTTTDGQIGDGQLFDGSDGFLNLGNEGSVNDIFNGGGTVSAWINPTGWGEGGYGRVFSKAGSTLPTGSGWSLELYGSNESLLFQRGFSGGSGLGQWYTPTGSLKLDEFQQVTLVYDDSSPANDPEIYINGVLQTLTSTGTHSGTAGSDAAFDLKVGNYSQSDIRTFDGVIDNVQIASEGRSADWVKAQYLSTNDGFVSFSGPDTVGTLIGVMGNDIATDPHTPSATNLDTTGTIGLVVLNEDGTFTYDTNGQFDSLGAGDSTTDSFAYTLDDGVNPATVATVTITVNGSDDPAIIGGTLSYTGDEGDAVGGTMTATDAEGLTDTTYFTVSSGATNGTALIDAETGAWSFTPTDSNWFGSDSFEVTVTDDLGGSTSQLVSITLANVDDAAVISGDTSYTGNEGDAVGGDLDATDVDGLADTTYFTVTTPAANGTALIDAETGAWSFTPTDPNWFGTDSFEVTVTDDLGGTTTQLVSITLANVDDAAVISGDVSFSGNEADAVGGDLNATDVDGLTDTTYFTISLGATSGTALIDAETGAWSFTPTDPNWFGSDSFEVTVTDDLGGTTTQLINITLANVDDAAVITGDTSYTGNEGDVVAGDLDATDADGLTDTTYFTVSSAATNGTALVDAETGAWSFTPTDSNWFGTDSFEVTVTDDLGGTTTQLVSINLVNVDDSAVITGDLSYTGNEGDAVAGDLNATDVDGLTDSTYFTVSSAATNGTALVDAETGAWSFTPTDPNWFGTDSFEVTVTDDLGGTTTQLISITLANADDGAIITGDTSYTGNEGDSVGGDLDATDVDGLTDTTYFTVTSPASNGTALINAETGAWSFTPTDPNWFGSDSFEVTVTDDLGGTTTQLVSVTLANVDDTAVITGDVSFSGNEGDAVAGDLDATDVDGLTDTTYFTISSGAANGTALIDAETGAWSFTPTDSNWFGTDSFEVTVTDDLGGTTTQLINITLANADDGAIITGDTSYTGNEGDAVAGDLNATDVDGLTDSTYFTISSGATNGTALIDAETGAWTFTPTDPNWFGTDSFEVTVTDDLGGTTTQLVSITLANQGDAAVITGDTSFSGNEGDAVAGDLNATDVDGLTDTTYFTVSSGATNGTAIIDTETGAWSFTPTDSNWFGSDSFEVTVTDDLGGTTTQLVSITLANVDDAAVITGDIGFSGNEGDAVVGDLDATDVDGLADTTYFTVTTPAANGTALIDAETGAWSFTPTDPDWYGSDSFEVTVTDDLGGTTTQLVSISLANVDDAAVVTGDVSYTGNEGDAVAGDLDATDVDGLADSTYFTISSGATNGTALIDAETGAWSFTPTDANWFGSDSFEVTVTDDLGGTTTQLVNITLANVDDAAVISGDVSFSGNEGDAVAGDLDATDVDGLADTTYFTVTSGATNGTAVVNAETGVWSFTPTDPNWFGTDSFEVTVTDDLGGTATQLVSISLANVDDAAVVTGDTSYTGNEGDAVAGDLDATDVDGLTDTTYFTISSGASNGTAVIDAESGAWSFTPTDPNWFGTDSFEVTVTDDLGGTTTQLVSINLASVNDAPTAIDDSASLNEGASVLINLAGNDSDPDDALDLSSIVITSGPANGTLVDNNDGTVTYTHDGSETLGDSFSYTIADVSGDTSNIASVTLTIAPQNDAPLLGNKSLTIAEGGTVVLSGANLSATDAESAAGSLQFSVTGVAGGRFELVSSPGTAIATFTQSQVLAGDVQFAHDGGELAPAFDVSVSDGSLVDGPISATIVFTNVNDAPTLDLDADDSVTVGTGFDSTFVMAAGPIPIVDGDGAIADVDSTLVGLDITITNMMDPGTEFLGADTTGTSIIATYDPGTGILSLSGTDSAASYEQVLRTVTYDNTALPPDGSTRLIAFVADDGLDLSATVEARVTIVVSNVGPSASPDLADVDEGGSVVIDVASNDSDPEGALDLTSIQIVGGPTNGSVVVGTDGTLTYTHDGTETTSDVLSYTIQDTDGAISNVETVSITIAPVNDAPTATDESFAVNEDVSLAPDATAGVLSDEFDAEGDTLTALLVSGPTHASSFGLNADGSFAYVPNADFFGTDQFSYRVGDGTATTGVAVVSLTVIPVNDAPTMLNNLGTTLVVGSPDTIESSELSVGDIDDAAASLQFSLTSAPTHGHLELTTNPGSTILDFTQDDIDAGRLVYLLDNTNAASDSLSFDVSDASGASLGSSTFQINVYATPPLAESIEDGSSGGSSEDESEQTEPPAPEPEEREGSVDPPEAKAEPAPPPADFFIETRIEIRIDEAAASTLQLGATAPEANLAIAGSPVLPDSWTPSESDDPVETSSPEVSILALERQVEQALDRTDAERSLESSDDHSDLEIWVGRSERVIMATGLGLIAALLRGGSLMALTVSSVPLWKGLDPVAALLVSDQRRERRASEIAFAERLEDETDDVGRVLDTD